MHFLVYLTFLDQLFAVSYAIALGLFGLFTWGTNLYSKVAPEDRAEASRRIDRTDLVFQLVALFLFIAVAGAAWVRS